MSLIYQDEDFKHLLTDKGDLFLKYIFDKYYGEFCKISFKYTGRLEIAEDIVQEVFINIWNKRYSLNCTGNVKPYFIRSVINASINYIQSLFARQRMVDETHIENVHSFNHHDVISNELNMLITKAIETLPERCRIIFSLSRFSGLSNNEISQELNISVKTIENQITIAIKKMHAYLKSYGYYSILFFLFI